MEEEKKRKEERVIKDLAGEATVLKLPKESPYGVTQKYDRSKYDSPKARKEFHDRQFGGKKTVRDADGTLLHRNADAAKRKYGKEKASEHAAQADHIDPVADVHKRHKRNGYITDEDIKEVVNRSDNFEEKSAHDNTSKGKSSEIKDGLDPTKEKTLKKRAHQVGKGASAQAKTDILIAKKTVEHMADEFLSGAKDALVASAIPLVIRGTQDLMRVAKGDMTMEEAVEDVGQLGLSIAASGGTVRTVTVGLGGMLKVSENSTLKKFADVTQIGNVLIIGSIVVRAAGKYLDGEVDAEGFFKEVGQESLSLAAGMLASKAVTAVLGGAAVGGPVTIAPMLAAMAASAACQEIYAQAERVSREKKDNEDIRHIAAAASAAIQEQQRELRRMMDEDHAHWADEMNEIFQGIAAGLASNDLKQINPGLRNLSKSFSSQLSLYDTGEALIDDLVAARAGKKDLHLLRGET